MESNKVEINVEGRAFLTVLNENYLDYRELFTKVVSDKTLSTEEANRLNKYITKIENEIELNVYYSIPLDKRRLFAQTGSKFRNQYNPPPERFKEKQHLLFLQ